ncbi:MAG: DUF4397 domain-containing protein [Defluviitaleaceae bacterium]|nr:DUF4397 domain-containing protein [Defluviitaleaceae bacterium]
MDELCNVRFFNGTTGVGLIDIFVNGVLLVGGLEYGTFSPFLRAVPGIYSFELCPRGENSEFFYLENIEFPSAGDYTLATTGNLTNLDFAIIRPEEITDMPISLPNIRFANLVPFYTVLDLTLDDRMAISGLLYKETSEPMEINSGNYRVRIFDSDTARQIMGENNLIIEPNISHLGIVFGEIDSPDSPVKLVLTNDVS